MPVVFVTGFTVDLYTSCMYNFTHSCMDIILCSSADGVRSQVLECAYHCVAVRPNTGTLSLPVHMMTEVQSAPGWSCVCTYMLT